MPTVAELDVQIDATNKASDELARVHAAIERLDGEEVDVDIDADGDAAEREIRKVLAAVRAAARAGAEIPVGLDDEATKEMAALQSRLRALAREKHTVEIEVEMENLRDQIRAEAVRIKVEADDAAARARLAQLDAFADSIAGMIKMDMNDARVRAKIAALKTAISSLDKNINLNSDTGPLHAKLTALEDHFKNVSESARAAGNSADSSGRRGGRGLEELSLAAERAGGNVRGLIAAGLLLWPALVPVAGAATAALGGFTLAATSAGIGTGLFAAVAVTNYNDVTEAINKIETAQRAADVAITDTARENALKRVAAEYANLTDSQAEAVRELMNFKTTWRDFAKEFEPQVFGIMANGLNLASEIFPQLGPMVASVGNAFDNLIDKAREALAGPFWQSFITMLNRSAGPALETLVTGLGNIVEGFAGMLMAFDPFQEGWNKGFINMTESFKEWGTTLGKSQGFKDFMNYAQDAIPRVNDFLGSLMDALVAVVRAVAPYGDIVLSALTKVLDVITFLGENAPHLLALAVAAGGLTAAFVAILGPITSVLNVGKLLFLAFTGAGGALGKAVLIASGAVGVFAALAGGLIWAYQNVDTFREAVDKAADAIQQGFQTALDWFAREVGPGIAAVGAFLKEEWARWVTWAQELAPQFAAAWEGIKSTFTMVTGIISAIWTAAWEVIKSVVTTAWPHIQATVTAGMELVRSALEVVLGLLSGDWSLTWNGLSGIVTGAWDLIIAAEETGEAALKGLFEGLKTSVPTLFQEMWDAINTKADEQAVVAVGKFAQFKVDAEAKWKELWTALEEGTDAGGQVVGGLIDVATAAWVEAFEVAKVGIETIWTPMWQKLRTTTSLQLALMTKDVQTKLNQMKTTVATKFAETKNAVTPILEAMKIAVRAKYEEVRSGIASKLIEAKAQSDSKWRQISAAAGPLLAPMVNTVRAKFAEAAAKVAPALAPIIGAVRAKFEAAKAVAAEKLATMIGTIGSFGARFYNAGRSLLGNFVEGVKSRIGDAVSEVAVGIARIANMMPGSPAKEGPLSGQGYTKIRGQHLVEDFATGMHQRARMVAREARDIADLATLAAAPDLAFSRIANGSFAGRRNASAGGVVVQSGAVTLTVQVGADVSPTEARAAFEGAGEDLAEKLALALNRR